MSATYLEVSKSQESERNVTFMDPLSSAVAMGIDPMIEDLEDVIVEEIPKIKIGICAMNKKTKSQPMQEILSRIERFDFVEVIIFSDDVIKNQPVEDWPVCDALISFYSSGFPLSKAIKYAELRKPFVLNDLEMQFTLLDRCAVYSMLESANIEIPRYAILLRDNDGNPIDTDFVELEDSIQIGNVVFQKPFVEKPVNAEDHNVFIYFPSSAGGGSQRLFRKVGSRSSVYSAESSVRKFGSYIYEDFVHTDGTDVKIYTVGPEYAHAEARKSPSLDGKVERDSQGKEIRYPVILNPYEKEIAHKVCILFKQTVCGFDLLRTQGKSYVCDVNGFSFVKTSKKYYDDCAQVLVNCTLQELAPQLYKPCNVEVHVDNEDHMTVAETLDGTMLELRCVVGIIRHGDRTPKQKMKMEVRHPRFLELFQKYNNSTDKKLKLKQPNQLQEVLDIARYLLDELEANPELTTFEKPNKLHQLKNVLEMYGHFSGINRKIQLKYLGKVRDGSESSGGEEKHKLSTDSDSEKTFQVRHKESKEEALLLIMKWGGELTQAGRLQAEELGKAFRCIYPGGDGAYSSLPGGGLLRLHSTYRHDLKIYASDEGRVQMTAAAFAKGFLALEGELTPILVHLVRSDKSTTEMLDTSDQATKFMAKVKHKLHDIMKIDKDFTGDHVEKLVPTKASSLLNAINKVKNPRQMCAKLSGLVHSLTVQLKELITNNVYNPQDPFLYHDETLELMTHRWHKLDKDFKLKNGTYDISLIPDIYDSIKYDIHHNSQLGLNSTEELYNCSKALADIVIPQEYGITPEEKVKISQTICQRLLKKIHGDLRHADVTDTTRLNPKYSQSVISPHRHVRTRLYFTSESHVHSVINAIRYGNLINIIDKDDPQWKRALEFLSEIPELNYMTQLVLMLYEDPTAEIGSENRFHIELHFSPGAYTLDEKKHYQTRGKSANPKPSRPFTEEKQDTVKETISPDRQKDAMNYYQFHSVCQSKDSTNTSHTEQPKKTTEYTPLQTSSLMKQEAEKQEHKNVKECGEPSKDDGSSPQEITEKPYECALYSADNKTYEDTVDTENERSRCAIGMDDFTDSTGSPVQGDSPHEMLPGKENEKEEEQDKVTEPDSRRRHCSGVNTEIFKSHRASFSRTSSESDAVPFGSHNNLETRQTFSDSNIYHFISPSTSKTKDDLCHDKSKNVQEESQSNHQEESKPILVRARSQSTSCIEDTPEYNDTGRNRSSSDMRSNEEENIETSPNTEALDLQGFLVPSTPTSTKSDTVVLNERLKQENKTLRIVHSSPTKMKISPLRKQRFSTGTMFYLPSILGVKRKLSIAKHGPCRIRPLATSPTDSPRPPIAEFYDEILSPVASIYPLLTLHNAIPLTITDSFLDRMTEEKNGESDVSSASTPATTPTRKQPTKKLSLKSSTHQQVLDNNDSIVSLEGLDLNEFKA